MRRYGLVLLLLAAPAGAQTARTTESRLREIESGRVKITAPGSTTARPLKDRFTLHVKDFGAVGNGTVDDTTALRAAFTAFAASTAETLDFGSGTYLVPTLAANESLGLFSGVKKKRFMGTGAVLKTTQFATGTALSGATWIGAAVTADTATPHGYTTGQLVGIYNATPIQLNGYYTVTVVDADTFTYTATYTPVGVFSAGTTQATNYNIRWLDFRNCEDVEVSGLRFEGSVLSNAVQSRIGYVGVYALNTARIVVDVSTQGLAYGVLFEQINTANVRVVAKDTGYGVAYSLVSNAVTYVDIDTSHRGAYLGGVSNSNVTVLSKNHDITAAIVTSHVVGGVHTPCKNLTVDYTDTGTSLPESHGGGSVVGILISGYGGGAGVVVTNITARFHVTETTAGVRVRPFVLNTFDGYTYNGIRVAGFHDKTVQATADRTLEFLPATAPAWDTSVVNGVDLDGVVVRNPVTFTPSRYWFSNLAGNVRYTNVVGEVIDPTWVDIHSGAGVLVADFGAPLRGAAPLGGRGVTGTSGGTGSTNAGVYALNNGAGATSYAFYGETTGNGNSNVAAYGYNGGSGTGGAGVLGQSIGGYGLRGITATGTAAEARQDGASGTNPVAQVTRNSASTGTGPVLLVEDTVTGASAPLVKLSGASEAGATKEVSTWTSGAGLAGYVRINVNGTDRWLPHYSAPTGAVAPVSADRGDTSQTLTVAADSPTQRWATPLTANRTVTISTTGAVIGNWFRIVRTGLGAFTLDVGGLKTIPAATAAFVDVVYNGTAWVIASYGELTPLRGTATTDVASIAAQTCSDVAVTVAGAVAGAECAAGPPSALPVGLSASCYVSAANTAQVRLCNVTAAAIDPVNLAYGARAWNP